MDEKMKSAVIVRKAKVIPVRKNEKPKREMTRFDGILYDADTKAQREAIRLKFIAVEQEIAKYPLSLEKELILSRLEEAFMWVGKLLRNSQAKKNLTAKESKK